MNPLLQMHHPEDTFIDQMALGKLVIKTPMGDIQAASLEGLIAQIIKVLVTVLFFCYKCVYIPLVK